LLSAPPDSDSFKSYRLSSHFNPFIEPQQLDILARSTGLIRRASKHFSAAGLTCGCSSPRTVMVAGWWLNECAKFAFGMKTAEKAHERTGLPGVAFLAFVASAK
jgi:hypothetical protein